MNKLLELFWFPINAENLHIRSEQIRSRLKNYLSMIGGQVLVLCIFDWMMWDVLPRSALLMYDSLAAFMWSVELWWWWNNRNRVDTVQEENNRGQTLRFPRILHCPHISRVSLFC